MQERRLLICGECGSLVVVRQTCTVYHPVLTSDGKVAEDGPAWKTATEGLWCSYCEAWRTHGKTEGDELLVLLSSGILKLGPDADTFAGQHRLMDLFTASQDDTEEGLAEPIQTATPKPGISPHRYIKAG